MSDGMEATAALIDDSDKIVGIDNGDSPIGGASIDSVMEDYGCGCVCGRKAQHSIYNGYIDTKSNIDYSSFTQATVVSPPKKGSKFYSRLHG